MIDRQKPRPPASVSGPAPFPRSQKVSPFSFLLLKCRMICPRLLQLGFILRNIEYFLVYFTTNNHEIFFALSSSIQKNINSYNNLLYIIILLYYDTLLNSTQTWLMGIAGGGAYV